MNLPDTIRTPRLRAEASVHLDANESPFNTPDNLYPDAILLMLRKTWGCHEHIPEQCIYFTNGTEEAIDLSMRVCALPGRDSVATVSPTRTIYKRRALINRLEYREAPLIPDNFALNVESLLDTVSQTTKMIFLCSPNSPTGNVLARQDVETVLGLFDGMVIVDESYIDYAPSASVLELLNRHRNLVILRSFSHAWSAAGLRLAAIVAHPSVIDNYRRMGWVHPLSSVVARAAQQMVNRRLDVDKWVRQIVAERGRVELALKELPECIKVYPSEANFILASFSDNTEVYKYLLDEGIAVHLVREGLRITVGLPCDNSSLLGALRRRMF